MQSDLLMAKRNVAYKYIIEKGNSIFKTKAMQWEVPDWTKHSGYLNDVCVKQQFGCTEKLSVFFQQNKICSPLINWTKTLKILFQMSIAWMRENTLCIISNIFRIIKNMFLFYSFPLFFPFLLILHWQQTGSKIIC